MAVEDLKILHRELPEVFVERPLPPGWEENWIFVPTEDPENAGETRIENVLDREDIESPEIIDQLSLPKAPADLILTTDAPDLSSIFPGAPVQGGWSGAMPPPDAFAFYLPFHYYYPKWWGIYIVLERAHQLAEFLSHVSKGLLTPPEAFEVVKLFLYAHEHFHHVVECFATRLEVTHRVPLYKNGFNELFQRLVGTDNCLEEALATAYAYERVKKIAIPNDAKKRTAALEALEVFIRACPPGYRRALEYKKRPAFIATRSELAEQNHNEALPHIGPKGSALWATFPHAFSGIGRVNSRISYIVQANSPFANRHGLRLLRYRELADKLRSLGCKFSRPGRGSHEIWESPSGSRFPIPRHPGDFGRGLLSKILRQASLNLSVSQLVAL